MIVQRNLVFAALCLLLAMGSAARAQTAPACASASGIYVPAQGVFGLLMFEDNYPNNGDDDFNDQVIAYNYVFSYDANGNLLQMEATYGLLAAGAAFHNGLNLNLPGLDWSAVSDISLKINGVASITPAAPSGQTGLVIPLADDTRSLFPDPSQQFINTAPQFSTQSAAPVLDLIVTFAPGAVLDAAQAPFDVFLSRNSPYTANTQLEIHKPIYPGTVLMDPALFGHYDDGSKGALHFINKSGLPFALDIPQQISWMIEQSDISGGYQGILDFAAGNAASNWYAAPTNAGAVFTQASDGSVPPLPGLLDVDIAACLYPCPFSAAQIVSGVGGLGQVLSPSTGCWDYSGAVTGSPGDPYNGTPYHGTYIWAGDPTNVSTVVASADVGMDFGNDYVLESAAIQLFAQPTSLDTASACVAEIRSACSTLGLQMNQPLGCVGQDAACSPNGQVCNADTNQCAPCHHSCVGDTPVCDMTTHECGGLAVTAVVVSPASDTEAPGTHRQYQAYAVYNNGAYIDVSSQATFASDNPAAATIDAGAAGLVDMIANGTAHITATYAGFTGTLNLTVYAPYMLPPLDCASGGYFFGHSFCLSRDLTSFTACSLELPASQCPSGVIGAGCALFGAALDASVVDWTTVSGAAPSTSVSGNCAIFSAQPGDTFTAPDSVNGGGVVEGYVDSAGPDATLFHINYHF